MPIDDRKQRILMEIVSLYAAAGEPVGSSLLSRHFDMPVSSATLRNEMAALTRLGLLEQPHTSAGRVPTAAGYRYYVDNLLGTTFRLTAGDKQQMDAVFRELDSDPEKLAEGAAKALSQYFKLAVIATTPGSDDMSVAHFEVVQVGRFSAAVLAVTAAGGVRTRIAKVDFELGDGDIQRIQATLNHFLRFVTEADVTPGLINNMMNSLDSYAGHYWPVVSAALTLLNQFGQPSVYFEGHQHLLRWPELEPSLRSILELVGDDARMELLIRPHGEHTTVQFGEELEKPIPGLCIVSSRYFAGGGLAGTLAVAGPTRMRFGDVIPKLEYFTTLMGRAMNGVA